MRVQKCLKAHSVTTRIACAIRFAHEFHHAFAMRSPLGEVLRINVSIIKHFKYNTIIITPQLTLFKGKQTDKRAEVPVVFAYFYFE
jgi:hypothetical protein